MPEMIFAGQHRLREFEGKRLGDMRRRELRLLCEARGLRVPPGESADRLREIIAVWQDCRETGLDLTPEPEVEPC